MAGWTGPPVVVDRVVGAYVAGTVTDAAGAAVGDASVAVLTAIVHCERRPRLDARNPPA